MGVFAFFVHLQQVNQFAQSGLANEEPTVANTSFLFCDVWYTDITQIFGVNSVHLPDGYWLQLCTGVF